MIQKESRMVVADNSGAKIVLCIGVGSQKYARVGDLITVTVKRAQPHSDIKKGDVLKAVVVRTKKEIHRKNGVSIKFDDNAVVIINKGKMRGTRVFGPVSGEIRKKYKEIASLAAETI